MSFWSSSIGLDLLGLRVVEADRLVEDLAVALDGDADVLVDGGAEDRAVVLLVERGQIGPAAGEADAQGRPGDDQRGPASVGLAIRRAQS